MDYRGGQRCLRRLRLIQRRTCGNVFERCWIDDVESLPVRRFDELARS